MSEGNNVSFVFIEDFYPWFRNRVHPRDKLDVGYRLSRSGLAVAYGYKNITYQGPMIADISIAGDSSTVNVTYSNVASPSIELRNSNGFEVCFMFYS
jgi:sialate O-acetylesterase